MKIWGPGPFENESAAAFAQEVQQDGLPALPEALEVVLDPDLDYLEAEEAARALAAAEILAAVLDGQTTHLTDAGLRVWVQQADASALAPWRTLAQEAVRRVLAPDSELPDLWADEADTAAQGEAWQQQVMALQQRLA